ncbi:MAG TPA: VOC family protein [Mycobacterium sp.]|nr:VOC family protein [Mycobacterium sp.]
MNTAQEYELPPRDGFLLTHFVVVSDQDRSRDYYQKVFGAKVIRERDPVILRLANSWLILNVGGGPTADKPTVTLTTPTDPNTVSAFLNIRVADIHRVRREWAARGAHFDRLALWPTRRTRRQRRP